MKKLIINLLTIFVISQYGWAQSSWFKVESPVDQNLVSVCFVDMDHGWILSEEGTVLATDNGGQSWQTSSLGAGTFTSIFFVDQDNGCITGYQDSSFIMLTGNGGAFWQEADHPKAGRLNDVHFPDFAHGWAVGVKDNMNYILYTENAGVIWVPQGGPFVQGAELNSVSFRNGTNGNTCGAAGAFFTTSSGGNSWALDVSIPSLGVDLYSIHNWGVLNGCAVGSAGTALHTKNNWATYDETNTNIDLDLYAVSADPVTSKIWAAGEDGTIIWTPDPLLGWAIETSGNIDDLWDIDMIDDEYGWAVGDNGAIWKYGPGAGTEEPSVVSRQSSVRVFPNPTSGSSRFAVRSSRSGHMTLKICDLHGREVMMVLDEEMPAGEHTVQVNLSRLPEGVYFCKLAVGSQQSAVGKVIKF